MDTKRNCSERMRPFLKAMERSIETARRNRTNQGGYSPEPLVPTNPAPKPIPSMALDTTRQPMPGDDQIQRQKARPKRLDSPLLNPFEQQAYRSRAS